MIRIVSSTRAVGRTTVGVVLLLGLSVLVARDARATGAANDHTVLVLGSTVGRPGVVLPADSVEAEKARALGMDVEIVDDAGWAAKSFTDFRTYRAIVLGDPYCGDLTAVTAADANAAVWGPAISGNLVLIGTDEFRHDDQGGTLLTEGAMAFAVADAQRTGAFISMSCYYEDAAPHTPVHVLDGISPDGFVITGAGCKDDVDIVASHPALALVSDTSLSNWTCSVHEEFEKWPADFQVFAIAKDAGAVFTASDGTVGTPYILARGEGLKARGLSLSPVSATSPTGTEHTITATLTDTEDSPVGGALIAFTVTSGPNTGVPGTCDPAGCTTDGNGQVKFRYTGNGAVGTDSILAFLDENSNRTADIGEAEATAAKAWFVFDPFGGAALTTTRNLTAELHKPSRYTTGVRCVQTDVPDAPSFGDLPFAAFPEDSDDVNLAITLTGDSGSKSICCQFQGGPLLAPLCSAIELQVTPPETCDNCVDDDGNGATDFEDAACCAQPATMQITNGKIVTGKVGHGNGKLLLKTILAQLGFGDVNPTTQDTTIQLRNANGELFCATVRHDHWMKVHRKFAFRDRSGMVAAGLTDGTIVTGRSGATRFRTHGKLDLSKYDQPQLKVTVRVGDHCSTGTVTLRKKGSKALVFP